VEDTRDGQRLQIGGLCWSARHGYGDDPLAGLAFPDPPAGRPDWKVLLLHGNIEDHVSPNWQEPVISKASLSRIGADLIVAGHVHTRCYLRLGETHILVPGATERLVHQEFDHDPGFAVVELGPGRAFRYEWVTHPAQPRQRIVVRARELIPEPLGGLRHPAQSATAVLLERVQAGSHPESITALILEGDLPRAVYQELDLLTVQQRGQEWNFFFEISTADLVLADEQGEAINRGQRLSQVEEVQETVKLLLDQAASEEERRLLRAARDRVLAFYVTGEGDGRT